jgi:hypothetical protein
LNFAFCFLRFAFGVATASFGTASRRDINRLKFSKAAGPSTISRVLAWPLLIFGVRGDSVRWWNVRDILGSLRMCRDEISIGTCVSAGWIVTGSVKKANLLSLLSFTITAFGSTLHCLALLLTAAFILRSAPVLSQIYNRPNSCSKH